MNELICLSKWLYHIISGPLCSQSLLLLSAIPLYNDIMMCFIRRKECKDPKLFLWLHQKPLLPRPYLQPTVYHSVRSSASTGRTPI